MTWQTVVMTTNVMMINWKSDRCKDVIFCKLPNPVGRSPCFLHSSA